MRRYNFESLKHLFDEIVSRLNFAEISPRKNKLDHSKQADSKTSSHSCQKMSTSNLTSDFCRFYLSLPHVPLSSWCDNTNVPDKHSFLKLLLDDKYGIDKNTLALTMSNTLKNMQNDHLPEQISTQSIHRIRDLCTPRYERVFNYILGSAQQDLGVAFLVKLRQDMREIIHCLRFSEQEQQQTSLIRLDVSKLRAAESDIQRILTSLFRPGVLDLQKITYDKTPANIIEQIALKEAVHPLQSLNDLRIRLGPGRRCYAFFHPALPDSPLVFVHVALLTNIPQSMNDLHKGTERIIDGIDLETEATCATFYSITNTNSGLVGVDLGNHLIKSVVQVLKNEFTSLDTFCTLSPIPNFRRWLEEKATVSEKFVENDLFVQNNMQKVKQIFNSAGEASFAPLLEFLKDPEWYKDAQVATDELKLLLLKLAAHYLSVEKHHGRPLCPVAKFHIRNGAEMFRLNYLSDTTPKGLRSSCGIMINYKYSSHELEENHANYERTGEIVVKDGVSQWLD